MNNSNRIALIGYGAMGKELEAAAADFNFSINRIFEIDSPFNMDSPDDFDIAIDFSNPSCLLDNIKTCILKNKSIVIGTTGWNQYYREIKNLIDNSGIGCVYSSNYSVGMQMFMRIVAQAAALMNASSGFDIFMNEIHHKRKADSPSGTALSLANIILENVDYKKRILADKSDGKIDSEQLHVSSVRGGEIAGTHTIYIDSVADTIELTHRAKNRRGFALGALDAAKWLPGKKGLFDFKDILNEIWGI
ncbi:MAG: 4-hydroxy-tetrahydrodipicolinate reductase [Candidatus Kapabacteria bacterium]|nr:4-hydroxy-tetrahydrodipicolinate reductase [Candidatus Kapabacteria bacterium]